MGVRPTKSAGSLARTAGQARNGGASLGFAGRLQPIVGDTLFIVAPRERSTRKNGVTIGVATLDRRCFIIGWWDTHEMSPFVQEGAWHST
jgi:hypothetical protein